MKRFRFPAVLLAAALQLFPLCRQICTLPQLNSTLAIIFRWAVGAAIAAESVDAVSGGSQVYFTMPSTNFSGSVGVPVNFLLTITNYGSDTGAYFTNATGFPLPDGLSITTYDHPNAHPPDLHGNIVGTPLSTVTNLRVKLTANYKSGGTLLTISTNIYITIQANTAIGPSITNQPPASQTIAAGGTAAFQVGVSGTAPFTYQWRLTGTNLANATQSSLTLNNVRTSQAGTYTVVVSNSVNAVTSNPALLNVSVPAPPSLTPVSSSLAGFAFSFNPVPGLTNSVLTNASLAGGTWGVLTNIPPPPNANPVTVTQPISGAQRFFRVSFLP